MISLVATGLICGYSVCYTKYLNICMFKIEWVLSTNYF